MSPHVPACAGFTSGTRSRRSRTWDHPRSRGVYTACLSRSVLRTGSSPLARGLPDDRLQVRQEARIIPARAGFTRQNRSCAICPADHPRSRGVYTRHSYYVSIRAGSPPLARGLLDHDEDRSGALLDHPRSRGVYGECVVYFTLTLGSSPLARGLPKMKSATYSTDRIIPARAGFTYSKPRTAFVVKDHPRSRGVYEHDIKEMGDAEGSSPLARGLHAVSQIKEGDLRIIPARAGFTHASMWGSPLPSDHPRSRGVYHPMGGVVSDTHGSSPLARGLLEVDDAGEQNDRIIPARAGFTGPAL